MFFISDLQDEEHVGVKMKALEPDLFEKSVQTEGLKRCRIALFS